MLWKLTFKMSFQFSYSLILNHKILQTAPSFIEVCGLCEKHWIPEKIRDLKINNWSVKTCNYQLFRILDVLGLWHPGQGPIAHCHPYLFDSFHFHFLFGSLCIFIMYMHHSQVSFLIERYITTSDKDRNYCSI